MMNFDIKTGEELKITHGGKETGESIYIDFENSEFCERFLKVYQEILFLQTKYADVKFSDKKDENGIPVDIEKMLKAKKELTKEIMDKLDVLFDDDLTNKIFKGKSNETLIFKFLEYLADINIKKRNKLTSKYTKTTQKNVM